jgi:hypothetical protein
MIPSLPHPQLDEHRTVIGELVPHRFVGLPVGDLPGRAAIDPGQRPRIDDNVINELREGIVPAAHGHLLRECGEIGVGRLAVVELGPDAVARLIEPPVEVAEHDEGGRPPGRRIDLSFQDRHLR